MKRKRTTSFSFCLVVAKDMHDQRTAHASNRISKLKIRRRAKECIELRMTDWVRGDGNTTEFVLLVLTCFAASFMSAMVKSEKRKEKKEKKKLSLRFAWKISCSEHGGGLRSFN